MQQLKHKHPYDNRQLNKATWLCLSVTLMLAILPYYLHLSFWVPSLTLTLIVWRMWLTQKNLPLPRKYILIPIMLAIIVAIYVDHNTLVGLNASVALLSLMLALKLMESRNLRDATVNIYIGYFIVATNFFFTQQIYNAIYMLVVIIALTAVLIQLNGNMHDATEYGEKIKLAVKMLLQSVPFMIVLFFLFPRLSNPIWSMPAPNAQARTGLSDHMSPGKISQLLQSDETVMRVNFTTNTPSKQQLYWRGPVLWDYDGKTWRRPKFIPAHSPISHDKEKIIDYKIMFEPSNQFWIIALDIPIQSPPQARLLVDHQIITETPITEIKRYHLRSMLTQAHTSILTKTERKRLLALPINTAVQAHDLASKWRQDTEYDWQIVQRALQYFRNKPFFYTLNPPLLNKDPVDQFLFQTRSGFCEHYASSFAVLMRHAGIPARIVTGYQGGKYHALGDYWRISQVDAHAWTEVWLKGDGWTRVDPTAAVAPERVQQGISAALFQDTDLPVFLHRNFHDSWIGRTNISWDSARYLWNHWVVLYDAKKQYNLLRNLGLDSSSVTDVMLVMIVVVGSIITVYIIILISPHHNRRSIDQMEKLYRQFLLVLGNNGIEKEIYEGAQSFAQRAKAEKPELSTFIEQITAAYIKQRYQNGLSAEASAIMKAGIKAARRKGLFQATNQRQS